MVKPSIVYWSMAECLIGWVCSSSIFINSPLVLLSWHDYSYVSILFPQSIVQILCVIPYYLESMSVPCQTDSQVTIAGDSRASCRRLVKKLLFLIFTLRNESIPDQYIRTVLCFSDHKQPENDFMAVCNINHNIQSSLRTVFLLGVLLLQLY